MTTKQFFTNKYTLSLLILLSCLATDIILHKGISRTILPSGFTDKRSPQNFSTCSSPLILGQKHWLKAINSPELLNRIPADTKGIECDIYYDSSSNTCFVYHDSSAISTIQITALLDIYRQRNLTASIWFDCKNLSEETEASMLQYMIGLRSTYHLQNKMIIESSAAQTLAGFCQAGFFTSYYTPFFNPYEISESKIVSYLDTIASNIKKYRPSALSGYYFQYPVLKKYFPNLPLLTWTDNYQVSLVANVFDRSLENDPQVKIILSPFK